MLAKNVIAGGLLLMIPIVATAAEPDLRLVTAAEQQHTRRVRDLVRDGVDVNTPTADGVTPLLWTAHWDDHETVDLLLRAGADVNAAEDHGVTPLAMACENASATMVDRLLAAGADPDAAQTNGVTPLMTAARTGNTRIVETLLAHDVDVNATIPSTGQTALIWATAERHLDIMPLLIAAGADLDAQSTIGFTPLLFATRNGDIEAATMLLESGAGVNEVGSDGTHALPLAIVSGHDELALFLLERGADPNGTVFGVGALHAAAGNVDMWLRDWLRVRGANTLTFTLGVGTASRVQIVKALLDHGADPNARITTTGVSQFYIREPKKGALQGGAGVWHIGDVDVELGLVYFVTGNDVPMFGGEARKGDNLYTASILALDVRTGELKWHYQVVHHDLWDADIAIAPLLYDAEVDGQPRKALAALRADRYFFLLDRETGEPIHPVEERAVTQDPFNFTSPTQPFSVGADSIVGECPRGRTGCLHRGSSIAADLSLPSLTGTISSHPTYRFRWCASPRSPTARRPAISTHRGAEGLAGRGASATSRGFGDRPTARTRPCLQATPSWWRSTVAPTRSRGKTTFHRRCWAVVGRSRRRAA